MGFVRFDKGGHYYEGTREPCIILTKTKSITFNTAFFKKHLADVSFFDLYYDEEDEKIGLKLVEEGEGGYRATKYPNNNVQLRCAAFFRVYGLDKKLGRYLCFLDEKTGMFVVDIKTKGEEK